MISCHVRIGPAGGIDLGIQLQSQALQAGAHSFPDFSGVLANASRENQGINTT